MKAIIKTSELAAIQDQSKYVLGLAEEKGDRGQVAYENGKIDAVAEIRKTLKVTKSPCRLCEFEEGWGKPFCAGCGAIFDPGPILERIKEYVSCEYKEERETEQVLGALDALISWHNASSEAQDSTQEGGQS